MIHTSVVLGDTRIRSALRSMLFLKHADEMGTVVIEELGLCRARVRVDVALVNSDTSRPFDKPNCGRIAVRVINHLWG